jgi:hypothetical protein
MTENRSNRSSPLDGISVVFSRRRRGHFHDEPRPKLSAGRWLTNNNYRNA